jgi:hypothetical protein
MVLVKYYDAKRNDTVLYSTMETYIKDSFTPSTCCVLELKIKGENYSQRKEFLRGLAVEYSHMDAVLSYNELYMIQNFFEVNGRRYGLINELKVNGII